MKTLYILYTIMYSIVIAYCTNSYENKTQNDLKKRHVRIRASSLLPDCEIVDKHDRIVVASSIEMLLFRKQRPRTDPLNSLAE